MMNGIVQYKSNFKTEESLIKRRNELISNLKALLSRYKYKLYIKQTYKNNIHKLKIIVYNE